ncbi:Alpha/Beta hydrolase protein [Crassisporium funariophilum]|nr:Alpha/Beta hydrolase protein [Crassisporium funariophilum]
MPYVKIAPPTGPLNVFYSISTPTSHDAESVVAGIPTILFLHPVYIAQQIFQEQFSAFDLRQFNLVAFDMRSHGQTEGVIGGAEYNPAADVYHFMKALRLPPCHLFGLSIGCNVSLDLATAYPEHVLSLTLCSPLTPVEPDAVVSGRLEVHEYWSQASNFSEPISQPFMTGGDLSEEFEVNDQILAEAVLGVKQLAFNNDMNSLTIAMVGTSLEQGKKLWSGSREKTREGFRAAVIWPLERKLPPQGALKKIHIPASIIYCTEDVAYCLENAQLLEGQLRDAGLKVELHQIPGPHYGCVASAHQFVQAFYFDISRLIESVASTASFVNSLCHVTTLTLFPSFHLRRSPIIAD